MAYTGSRLIILLLVSFFIPASAFPDEEKDAIYQGIGRGGCKYYFTDSPVRSEKHDAQYKVFLYVPKAFLSTRSYKTSCLTIPSKSRFDDAIKLAAARYNISEALIKAVIAVESNFNPSAVSPKGAMGLMQLMPGTASDYGVTDAFDPVSNIMGGTRFLSDLMSRFREDLELVIAAYNAGPGAVERFNNSIPPYPETQNYVDLVIKFYNKLRAG